MKFTAAKIKITDRHLNLLAVIYIRQSSPRQVIEHPASAALQRSLRELACHYGWPCESIVDLDNDQATTATDIISRKGFKWLRQQIFEERVGAIFCWDASRIARDNSAFAQLIKLCAATNTLVIDEKGVYDPNNENDRIFLGIMGVVFDAEGRRIAERSAASKRLLAELGQLRLPAPTGYILNDDGNLVFDTDEDVQQAISLLFTTYDKCDSVRQVAKYFNRNNIKFPTRKSRYSNNRPLTWVELSSSRALYVLRNPVYAGAFSYGRNKTIGEMISADTTEQNKKRVKVCWDADEVIIIHGAHPSYITWEKFIQNQQRIKDCRLSFDAGSKGAVGKGSALLQGIVKCAHCKRSLETRYSVSKGRGEDRYICDRRRGEFGMYSCFTISARRLDQFVANVFLEAISPAQVQITLRALEKVDEQSKDDNYQQVEMLKRAKAAVNEARLRYESIDPRNRLVADEYERRLEETLAEVKRLEVKRKGTAKAFPKQLSHDVRQSLLALAQDVSSIWNCKAVTHQERKKILRHLIEKVSLKTLEDSKYIEVIIHWRTGAITPLKIIKDGRFIQPEAIDLIRKLAPDHTVTQIIENLHQAGFRPVHAAKFSRDSLYGIFKAYAIDFTCWERPKKDGKGGADERHTTEATATMLNVTAGTVIRWCNSGILDSIRYTPKGCYWIKINSEQVSALKKPSRSRKIRHI